MEAISAYSFGSLAWLGLQSAPLLLWPSFISSMLSPDYTPTNGMREDATGIVRYAHVRACVD